MYVQDADASDASDREQSEGEPFHRAAIGAPMAMAAQGKKRKQQQRGPAPGALPKKRSPIGLRVSTPE